MWGSPNVIEKKLSALQSVSAIPMLSQYGVIGFYIQMEFSDGSKHIM